jgi:hypothetical protein
MNSNTTGLQLKKSLGLNNFKFVQITRVLATSAFRTYMIFFDSRFPNTPLTSGRILRNPMPSMVYLWPFRSKPMLTTPFAIEEFNGQLETSLFFVIDIAGYLGNPGLRTKVIEEVRDRDIKDAYTYLCELLRYNNIPDEYAFSQKCNLAKEQKIPLNILEFQGDQGRRPKASSRLDNPIIVLHTGDNRYIIIDGNHRFLQRKNNNEKYIQGIIVDYPNIRKSKTRFGYVNFEESKNFIYTKNISQLQEGLTIPDLRANSISSLNKKFLNVRRKEGESGSVLEGIKWDENKDSIFLTYNIAPTYSTEVTNYDPEGNEYLDNRYTAQIEFLNVSNYIGTKKDFLEFTPKEQGQLILQMINDAEVKLWSSDPSWRMQGSMENMTDLDASVYPYTGPKGKGIWNQRHGSEFHLSKHILEILNQIRFLYADIAKALRG